MGGGYPLEQMTFFNTLNLSEIIKKYKGTIIAQSAGAINCANKALSIPEEISRFDDPSTWEGLGITNLNIEPHFKMEIDHTNLEEKLIREKLLNLSLNNKIIGLPDGSHIRILDELVETFGENYIIENGIIIQKEKNKVKQ